MKKLLLCFYLASIAFLTPRSSQGMTYTGTDLLLVFRADGQSDVEFNIGSVSNFMNLPVGTVKIVTNFDVNVVLSNRIGKKLAGGTFVLAAATPIAPLSDPNNTTWLTDVETSAAANVPGSKLSTQISGINQAGNYAASSAGVSNNYYVVTSTDNSSYSSQVSLTGPGFVSTLGGASYFETEQTIPGTSRFYKIKASTSPIPPTWIGNFSLGTNGVLKFTAGAIPPAPKIAVARDGGINTISFSTVAPANYRIRYSSSLSSPMSTWTIGSSCVGTGDSMSLQDAPATMRFYTVEGY